MTAFLAAILAALLYGSSPQGEAEVPPPPALQAVSACSDDSDEPSISNGF